MKKIGICNECGAKKVEYRFGFNKGLAIFLARLYEKKGPARTDDLGLTYSQRTNSQKIRYWGLAKPYITEDTVQKRGWWVITQKGIDFITGKLLIPKYVVMYRNEVIREERPMIGFKDVSDGYKYHQDYADMAKSQLNRQETLWFEGKI